MEKSNFIIRDYENVLIGVSDNLPTMYLSNRQYQKDTFQLFRYVFDRLLGWSPYDVRDYLNAELIQKLKLVRAYRSLPFPQELDPKRDYWYVAALLYPKQVPYDRESYALRQFELVCEKKRARLPKDFFEAFEGEVTAALCLNYVISHRFALYSTKELYNFFSDTVQASEFLKQWSLLKPCEDYFDSPLDFLHFSLPEEKQDRLLFDYMQFKYAYKCAKEALYADHTEK